MALQRNRADVSRPDEAQVRELYRPGAHAAAAQAALRRRLDAPPPPRRPAKPWRRAVSAARDWIETLHVVRKVLAGLPRPG
jgi:anti-sigma factor RsiW